MKYAIGDIVMVRPDLKTEIRYSNVDGTASDIATNDMIQIAGTEVTIASITSNSKYRIKNSSRVWTDEMFCDIVTIPDILDLV